MRKYLNVPSLLPILLFACCQQQQQQSQQKDTTQNVQYDSYGDTIKTVSKAEQEIAYKNIKFGITQKIFEKKLAKNSEEINNIRYDYNGRFDHNGELYQFSLSTMPRSADYIDTELQSAFNDLVSIITKKYGRPDLDNGYPSILQMKSGYIVCPERWVLGNKIIRVGLGETQYSANYYVECDITDAKRDSLNKIFLENKIGVSRDSASKNF